MTTIAAAGMTAATADGRGDPMAAAAAIRVAGVVAAVAAAIRAAGMVAAAAAAIRVAGMAAAVAAAIQAAGMAAAAAAARGHPPVEVADVAAVTTAEVAVTDGHGAKPSTAETIRPAALSSGGPDLLRRDLSWRVPRHLKHSGATATARLRPFKRAY
ncbi:hypothetical protein ACFSHT_01920 [Paraburkholderia silviterrae]|uniref:hypothetical protein n=1 Tax=Paraburkholderia silviterrae TaxID=2528715 RepID=UPI0014044140